MNEAKQQQLLAAARRCPAVEPQPNFSARVLGAIRRDGRLTSSGSLFEQLNLLFPRLAMAALVVITVALAFQFYAAGDIVTQLADVSDEWLLPLNWL